MWRLLRTDRDGATADQIPQMAAAAVRYFLLDTLSPGSPAHLVPVGRNEWRFSEVRPLQVLEVSRGNLGPALPPGGTMLADRMRVPDIVPSVSAKQPWWVLVRFWWRETDRVIDYPGVRQGLLWPSWTLSGADWVLDRAEYVPNARDPGSATWLEALGDKAEEAVLSATGGLDRLLATVGSGAATLAVVLGLAWLLGQRR